MQDRTPFLNKNKLFVFIMIFSFLITSCDIIDILGDGAILESSPTPTEPIVKDVGLELFLNHVDIKRSAFGENPEFITGNIHVVAGFSEGTTTFDKKINKYYTSFDKTTTVYYLSGRMSIIFSEDSYTIDIDILKKYEYFDGRYSDVRITLDGIPLINSTDSNRQIDTYEARGIGLLGLQFRCDTYYQNSDYEQILNYTPDNNSFINIEVVY